MRAHMIVIVMGGYQLHHVLAHRLLWGGPLARFESCFCWVGTGFIMYYLTGFFGAARFGADAVDAGNILQNNLGQGNKQGTLNIFFAGEVARATAPARVRLS